MKNYESSQFYRDELRYEQEQQRQAIEDEHRMQMELMQMEYEAHLENKRIEAIKDMVNLVETVLRQLYEL